MSLDIPGSDYVFTKAVLVFIFGGLVDENLFKTGQ